MNEEKKPTTPTEETELDVTNIDSMCPEFSEVEDILMNRMSQ